MSEPLPGPAVRMFIDHAQRLAGQAERDWCGPPTHRVDECKLRKHYRTPAEAEALSAELEQLANAALVELSGGGWDGGDAEQRTQALLAACRQVLGWVPAQYRVENISPAGMQAFQEADRGQQAVLLITVRNACLALRRAGCAVTAKQTAPASEAGHTPLYPSADRSVTAEQKASAAPAPALSVSAAENPYREFEQFAWQIYLEEQNRNITRNSRPRPIGEAAAHIRDRELRLRRLGDAAMAAAHRSGFPVPEVEGRVKRLEDACVRVLLWERDAPHPTPEQRRRMEASATLEDPAGAYLIEQLNRLGDEIAPVRRLAACFDGRIEQQPPGSPGLTPQDGRADVQKERPMPNVNLDSLNLSALLERAESLHRGLEDYQRQAAAGGFQLGPLAPSALVSWARCQFAAQAAEAELTRLGLEANPSSPLVIQSGGDRFAVKSLRLWLLAMRGAAGEPALGAGWGERPPTSGAWGAVQAGMDRLPDMAQKLSELQEILRGLRLAVGVPAATLTPQAPIAAPCSGLLHFDLPAVFRCAVELGAAVKDQTGGPESREAEVAGERLVRVLNPRDAKFPSNFEWAEFQACREVGSDWTRGEEPRPGWRQELDLADAPAAARQALLTLGLALADLRGDPQWHDRGRELLSAGAWNLWDGMAPADRNAVRNLLTETHHLWGWPSDPAREPEPFTGPTATLKDPRILSPGWRTGTKADLDSLQEAMMASNFLIDEIGLPNGGRFPMYRLDCRPSNRALPSICPKAAPKPPVELWPPGDLLADSEAHYRSLGLIGEEQSLHWVGRQSSVETTCTCDLATPCDAPRPPEWQNLRQLRRSVRALLTSVQQWAGRQVPPGSLGEMDRIGERVAGLIRALEWELPRFPQLPVDQGARLRGPASLPVIVLEDGIVLMAPEREVRVWASEWRAILIAVEARLAALDPGPLPCQAQVHLQVDSREVPLAAPAGTPSPLREAFDAVADALFQAAEMRRSPPNGLPMFEDQARALCDALGKARKSYAKAELQLRAATDDGGHCAHQEALNAVCQVNDACGHVMLKIVPPHRATAHILSVPAFGLAELLRAMRRQTSRAAVQLQAVGARHAPSPAAAEEGRPRDGSKETLVDGHGASEAAQPDGPQGGCWLWWRGVRHDIPKGNVYKLVAFMWNRDSAAYDALVGPVFDDEVTPQTVRSLASKTKTALRAIGVPWYLATDSVSRQITKRLSPPAT